MRKASLVLGIIGSCLAPISGVIYILIAALPDSSLFSSFYDGFGNAFGNIFGGPSGLWYATGITGILAGICGIIACTLIKKKNVAAGVLMLIAAALATLCSFLTTALFVVGGIFALVKEKRPAQAMPAPYPPPYGAYPPPAYPAYGTYPPPPAYPAYGAYPPPPAYPAYGTYPPQQPPLQAPPKEVP